MTKEVRKVANSLDDHPARKSKGFSRVEGLVVKLVEWLKTGYSRDNGDRLLKPLQGDEEEKREAAKFYYENVRKEIDRENDLTFKRLNSCLTLQWFLLGSAAVIASATIGAWPITPDGTAAKGAGLPIGLKLLSAFSVFSICVLGALVSLFAFRGIESSRRSLSFVKDQWVTFNRINGGVEGGKLYPSEYPQPTKRANQHSWDDPNGDVRLSKEELTSGSFRENKRNATRILDRDEGYDFTLAVPALMLAFWTALGIVTLVTVLLSVLL